MLKTLSSQPKDGIYAWLIWGLAASCFGYAFFHRIAPAVMVSELMAEFAIGGAVLGTLSALYFYPYVLLQIPLGALLDIIGVRWLLTSSLLLAGVGSMIFGLADHVLWAYLGRILIGIGSSVGFLGSLALASKWFRGSRFGFLSGLSMFIGMTSGMLAQAPLALYVDAFGWRQSLFMLGAVGCGLAVLIGLFVRNQPQKIQTIEPITAEATSQPDNTKTLPKTLPLIEILKSAASDIQIWKLACVAATLSGPMLALAGLWGTPYLEVAYQLDKPQAAFFTSLLLMGWAVGAPLAGFISDKIGRRKPILLCGSSSVILALSILIFSPQLPLMFSTILFIIIGLAGGTMVCCFALARDTVSASYIGGAIGIINSMTVASGAVLQPLIGLVLDSLWSGSERGGTPIYLAIEYRTAFLLILCSSIIGFLVIFTVKE